MEASVDSVEASVDSVGFGTCTAACRPSDAGVDCTTSSTWTIGKLVLAVDAGMVDVLEDVSSINGAVVDVGDWNDFSVMSPTLRRFAAWT